MTVFGTGNRSERNLSMGYWDMEMDMGGPVLSLQSGTITIRRLRVRGTEERYRSKVLPIFKRGRKAAPPIQMPIVD